MKQRLFFLFLILLFLSVPSGSAHAVQNRRETIPTTTSRNALQASFGRKLAFIDQGVLSILDMDTGTQTALSIPDPVIAAGWSPDGRRLVVFTASTICLSDPIDLFMVTCTPVPAAAFLYSENYPYGPIAENWNRVRIVWSPDGQWIVFFHELLGMYIFPVDQPGQGHAIRETDFADWGVTLHGLVVEQNPYGADAYLGDMVFLPDNTLLGSFTTNLDCGTYGNCYYALNQLDLSEKRFHKYMIDGLEFEGGYNGEKLVVSADRSQLISYDLKVGGIGNYTTHLKQISFASGQSASYDFPQEWFDDFVLSPDGQKAAVVKRPLFFENEDQSSAYEDIWIWDIANNTWQYAVSGRVPSWSPNGSLLAFMDGFGPDAQIRFWSSEKGIHEPVQGGLRGTFPIWQPASGIMESSIAVAKIEDLAANPDSTGGVQLVWTAPEGGTEQERAAWTYELRYNTTPITEQNWSTSTPISRTSGLDVAGARLSRTLKQLPDQTIWYFGIRVRGGGGALSGLSNIPSLQQIPFRPKPNGYSFENWGESNTYNLTLGDLRRLFGDEQVCWFDKFPCIPKPTATTWLKNFHTDVESGHCAGISITSIRFYAGLDAPSNFQTGATEPFGLGRLELSGGNSGAGLSTWEILKYKFQRTSPLQRHIAYYQAVFKGQNMMDRLDDVDFQSPMSAIRKIQDLLRSGQPAVVYYSFPGASGKRLAHAVVAYAVQELGNDDWNIWVYDSNYPGDDSKYIQIHQATKPGSYSLAYFDNVGAEFQVNPSKSSGYLFSAYPVDRFPESLPGDCPWCAKTKSITVAVSRIKESLVVNDQGQRIGILDGVFLNEINQASMWPSANGEFPGTLIFNLPAEGEYTIELNGLASTDGTNASVAVFGPGYSISLDNGQVEESQFQSLRFDATATQVEYRADSVRDPELKISKDLPDRSYQFTLLPHSLGENQGVGIRFALENGLFSITAPRPKDHGYGLELESAGPDGVERFESQDIPYLDGDTLVYDMGSWAGSGSLTARVDHGSDGTEDQILEIKNDNKAPNLFLIAVGVTGLGLLLVVVSLLQLNRLRVKEK